MTVIFKEKRFTIEDYFKLQEVIDATIDNMDRQSLEKLHDIRTILISQMYSDGLDDELNEAITEHRFRRALKRKLEEESEQVGV